MASSRHTSDPPPTQVQPPQVSAAAPAPKREGLSIQTLIIAALASAAAALIVSRFWDRGTIIASAMTPVVVALVSEMLRKPAESELVRRPISVARSAVTSATPVTFTQKHTTSDDPEGATAPDVRIYSSGSNEARTKPRRRQLHLKLAIATGLIAFVIAALFLTVPELIFGESVSGGQRTTVFGGGKSSSSSTGSDEQKDEENDSGSSTGEQEQTDETTPQDSEQDQTETTPSDESTTAPDQTAPEQTTPEQTTPVPTTPAPAPTTPTTPVPVP